MYDLVAISGKKQSGKGTTASWFINNLGFQSVKFADPLKDMCKVFFAHWGLDSETIKRLVDGDLKELSLPMEDNNNLENIFLSGKSSRYLQQTLGTEFRSMLGSNVWVDMLHHRVSKNRSEGIRTIIDDVRFPDELNLVEFLSSKKIKIKNNRILSLDTHISEQELPDDRFDYIVENNGTIEELNSKLSSLFLI